MSRVIYFKGAPLTLVGRALRVGVAAPDFKVTSQDLKEMSLSDFDGKVKILTSFPSIDTPVCDLQIKEFNKKATELSKDVVILGISKDLPFAQKRFCESFDINGVTLLSDYRTFSFGINYGLLIKELNLLARSVVILDKANTVRYIQIVNELTMPPDYQTALRQLEEAAKTIPAVVRDGALSHCVPCEGKVTPLMKDKIDLLLPTLNNWQLVDGKRIEKVFNFKDFSETKYFFDLLGVISEEEGHHPDFTLTYNKLKVLLTTHAAGGLSENDFIMARIIDELAVE